MTSSILITLYLSAFPSAMTQGKPASYPKAAGWSLATTGAGFPQGQSEKDYMLGRDMSVLRSGHASATIVAKKDDPDGWRSLTQEIRADNYRGKRIRLSGFVKTKDVSGKAGIWLEVFGVDREQMSGYAGDRKIGTTDWTTYSVVVDVPKDAVAISFGSYLMGPGQMWADDSSLEAVDSSVAVTGGWPGPAYETDPTKPKNLD